MPPDNVQTSPAKLEPGFDGANARRQDEAVVPHIAQDIVDRAGVAAGETVGEVHQTAQT
jgi:hypothetical protein